MNNFKFKKCADKDCGNEFKQYNSLTKYCSPACTLNNKKTSIDKIYASPNKVSKKRQIENAKYSVLRIEFLGKKENEICKINGHPTTEIHHKYCGKDRAKYYLDTSTWLAVNRDSHNWIHENPKESRELGFLK